MWSMNRMENFRNALGALIQVGSFFSSRIIKELDTQQPAGVSPTTSTPTPTASNAKSVPVTALIPPEEPQDTVTDVIKELPPGAIKTWEEVGMAVTSNKPIYLHVVLTVRSTILQFRNPNALLTMHGDTLMCIRDETVCKAKFFNRNFLPTFFVFDNYLHAYALERKLTRIGCKVETQKFK
jgi:hypothetical protein